MIIIGVCTLTAFSSYNRLCQKYLEYCEKAGTNSSSKVGLLSFAPGNPRLEWDADIFKNIIQLPFADGEVNAPEGWHKYLLTQYGGDYMTPIRGGQTHSGLIYDTDMIKYFPWLLRHIYTIYSFIDNGLNIRLHFHKCICSI